MKSLVEILDEFAKSYAHVDVNPNTVSVSEAFKDEEGEYDGPRMYQPHEDNILAYTATGASLIEKFEPDTSSKGYTLRSNLGRDNDFKALTCFCLRSIRNTSLREVQHALEFSTTKKVQGYRQRHVDDIVNCIRSHQDSFDPDEDSAFIFAHDDVESKLKLNAYLLDQTLTYGGKAPSIMSDGEARQWENVFPDSVLRGETVGQNCYMPDNNRLPSEVSHAYLQQKVEAYQAWR